MIPARALPEKSCRRKEYSHAQHVTCIERRLDWSSWFRSSKQPVLRLPRHIGVIFVVVGCVVEGLSHLSPKQVVCNMKLTGKISRRLMSPTVRSTMRFSVPYGASSADHLLLVSMKDCDLAVVKRNDCQDQKCTSEIQMTSNSSSWNRAGHD